MTNVLLNEGFHTTLTWLQLVIGLTIGLLGVYAFTAMDRVINRTGRVAGGHGEGGSTKNARLVTNHNKPTLFSLASMRAAYHNLGVLAASRKPVSVGTIVHRVRLAQIARRDKVLLTSAAVRNSLERLLAQGSLKMEGRGLMITDAGMELFTKIARMRERGSPAESSSSSGQADGAASSMKQEPRGGESGTSSSLDYGRTMRSRHFFPTEILLPRTPLPAGFTATRIVDEEGEPYDSPAEELPSVEAESAMAGAIPN